MSETGRRRLNSWKEIAAHLGRQVRTVVRWEKERGLPVHRLPGGRGRSVFAFTDELDQWSAGGLEEDTPPVRRWPLPVRGTVAAAAVLLLVAAAVTAAFALRANPEIDQLAVLGDRVVALSAGGRELWRHDVGAPLRATSPRQIQLADVNRDGRTDAVVSADFENPTGMGDGLLLAIDHSGRELWRRTLADRLTFEDKHFSGPWQVDDVLSFTSGAESLVAWAVHHHTWWPSMLAVFDRSGTRVGSFVNSGWIRTVQPSTDGRHLIAGGLSNARNAAAFAVVDARDPDGSSPEEEPSAYRCRNCPAGGPLHYLVVPWSDVADTISAGERRVIVSVYHGGRIELRAVQRDTAEFIIELTPGYQVERCSAGDEFWRVHDRLERGGHLSHPRDKCPFKDGPQVRDWTPLGGWRLVCPGA